MPLLPLDVLRNWIRHEVDTGWAWVVVAASFTIQMIIYGIIQSYGTMFVALLDEFKAGEYETALIGSLAYGLQFFIGPISATLCEHFGCRTMVYIGTTISMVACFSSSFAPNLSTLYFTFGVLWGIGAGLTFFPCLLVLNFYFSDKISLANGIMMTGSGIGTLCFNVLLNKIIQVYDWRVAFRFLGGICILMFVCGSAYRPPPQDFYAIHEWQQYQKVKFTTKLSRIIDSRPWKNKAFVIWVFGISFVLFGYFIPYVHLVRFGETLNVPLSQSTLLVGYMSIAQIFSKLICGRLADSKKVKRLQILVVAILAFVICNLSVTAATSFNGLLAYTLIYGFFDGLFVVVLPLLICDLVGRDLMANAIGNFYGISSIPLTLGPPVSGQLYDAFGSYTAPFATAAALGLVGVVMMYFVYRLRPDLIKDVPIQALIPDEMDTSDLIIRPSIHSHTVDALSGMFITERFSSINDADRPSQLTINPLHHLTRTLSRSRAGSTASGYTQRFPSFSLDVRSEGHSEIFLQRLRGSIDASSVGSRVFGTELNVSTSTATGTDNESMHCKDISFDLGNINAVSTSSPNRQSRTDIDEPSEDSKSVSIDEIIIGTFAGDDPSTTNLESLVPTILITPADNAIPSKMDNEMIEPAPLDNQESINTPEPCTLIDVLQETDQISTNKHASIFNGVPSNMDSVPNDEEIVGEESSSTIKSPQSQHNECLSMGVPAPTDHHSPPISPVHDASPKTATLICIDNDLYDTGDISTTLIHDDIETTTETIVLNESEKSLESSDDHGDEILIKLPPPPTTTRELAPLVDLTETQYAHDIHSVEVQEKDVEITDVDQSSNDENKLCEAMDSTLHPQHATEQHVSLASPINCEEEIAGALVPAKSALISLNERLQIVAEQQQQQGELTMRFPTDEMTLFATYRSNIATPSEQHDLTPASQSIQRTPAPSTNQSPPRTPIHYIFDNDLGRNSTVCDDDLIQRHQLMYKYVPDVSEQIQIIQSTEDDVLIQHDTSPLIVDQSNDSMVTFHQELDELIQQQYPKTATLICIESDVDEMGQDNITTEGNRGTVESNKEHDEEIFIKLPPPPSKTRESPLVDLPMVETEKLQHLNSYPAPCVQNTQRASDHLSLKRSSTTLIENPSNESNSNPFQPVLGNILTQPNQTAEVSNSATDVGTNDRVFSDSNTTVLPETQGITLNTNPFQQQGTENHIIDDTQPQYQYPEVKNTLQITNEDVLAQHNIMARDTLEDNQFQNGIANPFQQQLPRDDTIEQTQELLHPGKELQDSVKRTNEFLFQHNNAVSSGPSEFIVNPFEPPQLNAMPEVPSVSEEVQEAQSTDYVLSQNTTTFMENQQHEFAENPFLRQQPNVISEVLRVSGEEQDTKSTDFELLQNTTTLTKDQSHVTSDNPFQQRCCEEDHVSQQLTYPNSTSGKINDDVLLKDDIVRLTVNQTDDFIVVNPLLKRSQEQQTSDKYNPFLCEGEASFQEVRSQISLQKELSCEGNMDSNAINVPTISNHHARCRTKSLVSIDDNSDYDPSSSNSLINVFEMELDEVSRDTDCQPEILKLVNAQDSVTFSQPIDDLPTNPFTTEVQET